MFTLFFLFSFYLIYFHYFPPDDGDEANAACCPEGAKRKLCNLFFRASKRKNGALF